MDLADIKHFAQKRWDAIVIGTGMGGAAAGFRLAEGGKKVLFLEKGRSTLSDSESLRGQFAETLKSSGHPVKDALARAGREKDMILDVSGSKPKAFVPFIGSGTGGSTAIYGAVLERFAPSDFTPHRHFPGLAGAYLPDRWPISYDELEPYYEETERLFLSDDIDLPPLSRTGRILSDHLRTAGLHPHRFKPAHSTPNRCGDCQGFLCRHYQKKDAVEVFLKPALNDHGATLISECDVERLNAGADAVQTVQVVRQGQRFYFQAETILVAAGALETPRLLLASASEDWKDGLANKSGLVGRYLMRHLVDLFVVLPKFGMRAFESKKELTIDDFYLTNEGKFGTLRSFGPLPPVQLLVDDIERELRDGLFAFLTPLFRLVKPIVKLILDHLLKRGTIFASILEDVPSHDNRVTLPSPEQQKKGIRLCLNYKLSTSDRRRASLFQEIVNHCFAPFRTIVLKQSDNNQRIAHACGTCRFGDDPATSVLNRWNRAHGLTNLHVVDASFFPSSTGRNPALTVAANALRVADHLLGRPAPSVSERKTAAAEEERTV